MPDNLFETRQRINAAAQTRKITRTMELVASSRLQRAKQQLAAFAPALRHLSEAAACLPEAYFTPDRIVRSGGRCLCLPARRGFPAHTVRRFSALRRNTQKAPFFLRQAARQPQNTPMPI